MPLHLSSAIRRTAFPPIAEAFSWVEGRQSNRELLNMCQAVPSYPPAPALQDEFARLAKAPDTGGYTDIFGIAPLRAAFAAKVSSSYAARVEPSDVAITTGCNQAFAAAIMALAKAGDNVIMPAPWYFNHEMWLSMLGVSAKAIPAFCKAGPWPDVAAAAKAITKRTRAILLVTPNNPTGAIYPPEVIAGFYALAKKANIALIIDETYGDFRPVSSPPHGLLATRDWRARVIQLFSFSKIYALAGYRLGAMVAGPAVLHEVAKILDTMTICPPHISQRGVLFALSHVEGWKNEKKAVMAERLASLHAAFANPQLKYELVSSGAYFAYVKHPFGREKSKSVAKRLAKEHDVLCLPGSMFGPGQEQHLRFAFANMEKDKMPVLAERLINSQ